MRVLAVDHGGFMLDFVMRAQADGHKVKWYISRTPKNQWIGLGLADFVEDWREYMEWADIVVLPDNTRYMNEMDEWRQRGVPIVGASPASADWELDRKCGQDVFKRNGIQVPPFREFSKYDEAIAYVQKEQRRFVSKPCGDEPDKSLSYVAKSPADMIYMLGRWKAGKRHKGAFILQEFIGGTEMAVGGWFGPAGFIEGWCENWEFKKLMAGETGPATGEMGTVVRYVKKSKLANLVLKPLEDELHKLKYCGYVDVNCIIDDKGVPYPLEFTMRPGWPTFNIQQALLKEGQDHVEWLRDLAEGRPTKPFLMDQVAVGVVMAIPDFPYSSWTRRDTVGIPIYNLEGPKMDNVHLCEVMQGTAPLQLDGKVEEGPCLVTAGDYLLVASGVGPSVRQAAGKAYKILKEIEVPNSPFWRPDIGQRLSKQLPQIQAQGYATGLVF